MEEREYYITIHSYWRFIVSVVGLSFIAILLYSKIFETRDTSFFVFALIIGALIFPIFSISHIVASAKIRIKLDSNGLKHYWERRFLLDFQKNVLIRWELIDNYVFEPDRSFDNFKLNLNNNLRYKFYRSNMFKIDDDFERFNIEFIEIVKNKNQQSGIERQKIVRGKTIYEDISYRWLFHLYGLTFIVLLIIKFIDPAKGTSWPMLGIIGSSYFFYLLMIYRFKK